MANNQVQFIDNSDVYLTALGNNLDATLEAIGLYAVGEVVQTITEEGRVDTGIYRNSITYAVSGGETAIKSYKADVGDAEGSYSGTMGSDKEKAVFIGSNLEHAVWNEVGTGKYASEPGGKQSPWRYKDSKGKRHTTSGMKGIHALKKAAANHNDTYKEIIEKGLKGEL